MKIKFTTAAVIAGAALAAFIVQKRRADLLEAQVNGLIRNNPSLF